MGNKDKFCDLLRKTERKGIEHVIEKLTELGFFEAPASTKFHGAYEGGLVEHSLNVYVQALYLVKVEKKIRPDIDIDDNSVAIAALLHDVCKSDIYIKEQKWRKDANNKWESYEAYGHDYKKTLPVGHGEKSVIRLLQWGLELTDDEIMAIRWHMGHFDLSDYMEAKTSFNTSCDLSPLAAIISAADWLASRITENKPSEDSK